MQYMMYDTYDITIGDIEQMTDDTYKTHYMPGYRYNIHHVPGVPRKSSEGSLGLGNLQMRELR